MGRAAIQRSTGSDERGTQTSSSPIRTWRKYKPLYTSSGVTGGMPPRRRFGRLKRPFSKINNRRVVKTKVRRSDLVTRNQQLATTNTAAPNKRLAQIAAT